MFYAVLALLATKKQETSKHSGAISIQLVGRVLSVFFIIGNEFCAGLAAKGDHHLLTPVNGIKKLL